MRTLLNRSRLKIRPLSKDTDFVADRRDLKVVLGWLTYHAMDEGMTKMALGVNEETGESWMRFYGPFWHAEPAWRDMVPPEAYCYPILLQVAVSLANLEAVFPLKGVIRAVKGRRCLDLELTVDEIRSFELSWDKRYAERNRPYWEDTTEAGGRDKHSATTSPST